jgi:large subunit ribosomal protein L11
MQQAPRLYKGKAKLIMYAGNAKPNPRLGQALGPLGLNMMQFCKDFNDRTGKFRGDVPLRIQLKAYTDRTYQFLVKPPPTSWFLKRCAMTPLGSSTPKRRFHGSVGCKYIYEIAKLKKALDSNFVQHNILGICKMIIAQAHNMGIYVVEETPYPTPILTKKV